jgi:hypothetical protein
MEILGSGEEVIKNLLSIEDKYDGHLLIRVVMLTCKIFHPRLTSRVDHYNTS